jgi:hypothetical protein
MSIKEQVLLETKKRLTNRIDFLTQIIFPETSAAILLIELQRKTILDCQECNKKGDYETPLLILSKAEKEEKRLKKLMKEELKTDKYIKELVDLQNQLSEIESEIYYENRKKNKH